MSYESVKEKIQAYKPQAALVLGFVLVFLVGFGSGRLASPTSNKTQSVKDYSNYNTKAAPKPNDKESMETESPKPEGTVQAAVNKTEAGTPAEVLPAGAVPPKSTGEAGPCQIKGNISGKGDKIYHVPGGSFYDRVKPEQCFKSEQEAKAAGFRKSSR